MSLLGGIGGFFSGLVSRTVDAVPYTLPPGIRFFDLTEVAADRFGPDGDWKVTARSGGYKGVTGICLHQTACLLGERTERWRTCGSHYGVTRGGQILKMHAEDRNVPAANGWNARCVSIEVDGLYEGVQGDPRTIWDDPKTPQHEVGMELPETAVVSTMHTIRMIVHNVQQRGGTVRFLVAHRQSSATRQDDPGSAIWQRIALPMQRELGLSDGGVGFKIDDGTPIPQLWDERCKGIRY